MSPLKNLKNENSQKFYQDKLSNKSILEAAEVFDIILDSSHDDYIDEKSIGLIRFKRLKTDFNRETTNLFFAGPLNSQIKNYPIKHEIVLIVTAPTPQTGYINQSVGFYYTDVVNIWSLSNHNALPYSTFPVSVKHETKANIYSTFSGITNIQEEIDLGDYFVEKVNRPNITPYEGDTIFQGRWGNTIRFSSTNLKSKNPWSLQGNDGDPIIILRSDKKDTTSLYVQEDINEDGASIYISDGQLIGLKPAYNDFKSYIKPPVSPSSYVGNQVVLNAGRLYFNAKQESVFISAIKSISLASKGNVNIDFKSKMIIGNHKTAEKTILGETFMKVLNSLVIPSPMGPLSFNTAILPTPVNGKTSWLQAYANDGLLSSKTYIE